MASSYNTPTASGRNTPLHFKDVVSFLYNPFKQLASLLSWAWDSVPNHVEPPSNKFLTEEHHFNFAQIEVVKQFKHEDESEAHQVRLTSAPSLLAPTDRLVLLPLDLPSAGWTQA